MGRHGRQLQLPAQLLHRRGRGRGQRHLSQDRVPRAPRPLCRVLGQHPRHQLRHQPGRVLRRLRRPRRPGGRARPGTAPTAWPTAGPRSAPTISTSRWLPAKTKSIIFGLGYIENPEEEKFAAPGIINKTRARAMMARYATDAQVDEARRALTRLLGPICSPAGSWTPATRSWTGWSTSGTSTSAWSRST